MARRVHKVAAPVVGVDWACIAVVGGTVQGMHIKATLSDCAIRPPSKIFCVADEKLKVSLWDRAETTCMRAGRERGGAVSGVFDEV